MRFELLQPGSLAQALEMKKDYREGAKILAGGTDLLVLLKDGKLRAQAVMSLGRLSELNFIRSEGERGVAIGALVSHSDVAASRIIQQRCPDLAEACAQVGAAQIQNLGTLGGNLCNASPAADAAPPLLLMDALLTLASARGERRVAIHDFFLGPRRTVLEPDEILKEIFVPQPAGRRGATYLKLGRRKAMEIAIVGVGVAIHLNGSDRIVSECRIAMSSVAPTPLRARRGEAVFTNQEIRDGLIEEAAEVAAEEASPISDVRATRGYRLDMIRVLCRRAAREALARARNHKAEGWR
ncbi:MAG: FAD binding domain-containing protein [Deltaproteobacteria bacterium]|nr:FAD binding domain-containing protein [Deltaproteobacteria bacterium]MBI2991489.1 FAD binding domain-containing protein [Deltaproteobacteria bacterium]